MWKFLPEYKLCSGETQIFQDDQNTLETIKKKQEVWTEYRARHKQLTGVSHVALHGLQLKIGPKSMNWKQACSFSYFQLNSDKSAQQKSVINIAVGRWPNIFFESPTIGATEHTEGRLGEQTKNKR